MKRFTSIALVTVLAYATLGLKCDKAMLCDDVMTGLQLASTEFPNDPIFSELSRDGHVICDAVRDGKKGIVPGLLRAFVPRFDAFVAKHGQNRGLALVDIGLHVLLNHFPPAPSVSASRENSVLAEYAAKPVWGCSYYPEKCKNGVPKD